MTQPEGRAMKYGIIEQIIPSDFIGQNKKVQILSLKKICREGKRIESEKYCRYNIFHSGALWRSTKLPWGQRKIVFTNFSLTMPAH